MLSFQEYFNAPRVDLIKEFAIRMNSWGNECEMGFYNLPLEFETLYEKIKNCKKQFSQKTHIVVLGMGGSSLGTRAITSFLGIENIDYLDNLSNELLNKILKKIDLQKTLFVIISKSGNTIETISFFRILVDKLKLNLNDLQKHFIGICMENTKLYEFLQKNNICHFDIKENVSGRFSVLSSVGIVPLSFTNIDVKSLILGAKDCMNSQEMNLHILKLAYILTTKMINKNFVLFSYCDELLHFNEWFIQLVAESLGKYQEYKRVGITPIGLIGPKDQHSFLQLIMEGPKDKFVQFIRLKPNANSYKIPFLDGFEDLENLSVNFSLDELCYAQSKSCQDAIIGEKIDVASLELDGKNAYNMGYLMYYYELLVSACGMMMGINTFNQPGVESAKKLLKLLLHRA